jgi:hypothetical protein
VERLPPYAPDLNPGGMCKGAAKRELLNATPESREDPLRQARRSFSRLGRRPKVLCAFFEHVGLDVT